MLVKKQSYRPTDLANYQQKVRNQKIKHIQRTIRKLDITADELAVS